MLSYTKLYLPLIISVFCPCPGCRGAPVKKRPHGAGPHCCGHCQGDSRCRHVGGGERQWASNGNKTHWNWDAKTNSHGLVKVSLVSLLPAGPERFVRGDYVWAFRKGLHFSNVPLMNMKIFCPLMIEVCLSSHRCYSASSWSPGCTFVFWTSTRQQCIVGKQPCEWLVVLRNSWSRCCF